MAWGNIQGYETLFWLEVGDDHKGRTEIEKITKQRLTSALKFCQKTGAHLVYVQASTEWVRDVAGWSIKNLPSETPVLMINRRSFDQLPIAEWGKVTDCNNGFPKHLRLA